MTPRVTTRVSKTPSPLPSSPQTPPVAPRPLPGAPHTGAPAFRAPPRTGPTSKAMVALARSRKPSCYLKTSPARTATCNGGGSPTTAAFLESTSNLAMISPSRRGDLRPRRHPPTRRRILRQRTRPRLPPRRTRPRHPLPRAARIGKFAPKDKSATTPVSIAKPTLARCHARLKGPCREIFNNLFIFNTYLCASASANVKLFC